MKEKLKFKGDRLSIMEFRVSQKEGIYKSEYVKKSNAVGAIVNYKSKVLLLQVKRPIVNSMSIEIPGGAMHEGESPEMAIEREIKEELGDVHISKLEFLTEFYTMPSLTNEKITIFSCELNQFENLKLQIEERIVNYFLLSKKEILQLLKKGKIINPADAYTLYFYYSK